MRGNRTSRTSARIAGKSRRARTCFPLRFAPLTGRLCGESTIRTLTTACFCSTQDGFELTGLELIEPALNMGWEQTLRNRTQSFVLPTLPAKKEVHRSPGKKMCFIAWLIVLLYRFLHQDARISRLFIRANLGKNSSYVRQVILIDQGKNRVAVFQQRAAARNNKFFIPDD